jgi:DNA-binding transcriptional ArsR family regulator
MKAESPTGDELLRMLAALANPHRLRIVAALVHGPDYVSRLARVLGMSRPLLHMHLQRLEAAGLIEGRHVVSDDGKAMRFVELIRFEVRLTPALIAYATATLSDGVSDQQKED